MAVPKSNLENLNAGSEPRKPSQDDPEKAMSGKPHIEDAVASGYVDQTVQLDSEENARLLKKIHWQ